MRRRSLFPSGRKGSFCTTMPPSKLIYGQRSGAVVFTARRIAGSSSGRSSLHFTFDRKEGRGGAYLRRRGPFCCVPRAPRAVPFRKSGDRCGEKRRRSPKNFAWISSRGPSLCLEVDAFGLGVFWFLFDALLFDEVIDGLRRLRRRRFGLFFGSLFRPLLR